MGDRRDLAVADDDQRLGDQHADTSVHAGVADVAAFQGGMIADVVRSLAVGHLPFECALIEINGRDHTVRRLHYRQALNQKTAASAASAARRAASPGVRTRASSTSGALHGIIRGAAVSGTFGDAE